MPSTPSPWKRVEQLRSQLRPLALNTRPPLRKVLIANRAVAASRVAHAAAELGLRSVAVYDAVEDAAALHVLLCDEAVALPRLGAESPYLDAAAIVEAARRCGADCVHPGYGFLAESADFARRCAAAGLCFVGPPAHALEVFGDKTRARALAASLQPPVPTLRGSDRAFDTAEDALAFVANSGLDGRPLMLKAANGGGGRGMRRLAPDASSEAFTAAFRSAVSEAAGAFVAGGVFVEELLERCRHVEVQVVADGRGDVAHLSERDCSVQLGQGSKVVEVCPAVGLHEETRQRLLDDAVRLIAATPGGYINVCTVEFLVEETGDPGIPGRHVFIEVNPRLQVEHGVTEEACGVDLVRTQFRLAAGESLCSSLGLPEKERGSSGVLPSPLKWAVEARVCLTSPPQAPISRYREPGGRGVRVDGAVHAGSKPSGRYDPLLALVIGVDSTLEGALVRTARALDGFEIGRVRTNLPLLREVLRSTEVRSGTALTTTTVWSRASDAPPEHLLELPEETPVAKSDADEEAFAGEVEEGSQKALRAPLAGLLRWEIAPGQSVRHGSTVAVILAMKLETPVVAPASGRLELRAEEGTEVRSGQVLAVLEVDHEAPEAGASSEPEQGKSDKALQGSRWRDIVAERARRAAQVAQAPPREDGRLHVRERVLALLDTGSFRELGPVAGEFLGEGRSRPANFVLGTGHIEGRPVIVGGEDFTIQGGSPNTGGLQKSVFCERYALQLRIPLVRLHEGGGGGVAGGRPPAQPRPPAPARLRPSSTAAAPEPTRFGTVADCLGLVPVATAALGAVAGLPASRLVASHFVVAVRGAQVLVAGPLVVENATGRRASKEELGGEAVHGASGVVDNYADDEHGAFEQIRRFLSYLPSNVDALPPLAECSDTPQRCEEELLAVVPENQGPYEMRRILELVVDRGSFFELGTSRFGCEMITGLARLAGHPVGIFANDPKELGGSMTWQAAIKTRRLIELCVTFHLPVITFVDQPGFMVGLEAEKAGTIRFGTAAVLAAATAPVPWCAVQVRKAYGVASAAHFGPAAHVLLWPSAESGTLPVEAGVAVMYRRKLEAAPPAERRGLLRRLVEERSRALSPWPAVQSFGVVDLIDPRETRLRLCQWVEIARLRLPPLLGPATFPYRP